MLRQLHLQKTELVRHDVGTGFFDQLIQNGVG